MRLQQGTTPGGMGPMFHFAEQQFSKDEVRSGSKADIGSPAINVRYSPEIGHCEKSSRKHRGSQGESRQKNRNPARQTVLRLFGPKPRTSNIFGTTFKGRSLVGSKLY